MGRRKIPPLFNRHWKGSDVVLITENADGKKLYAKKASLAENSSYFNAMFYHGFKESYQNVVEIHFDYEILLKVLQVIHRVKKGWITTSGIPLMDLYQTADDIFEMSVVKTRCIAQLKHHSDHLLNALCAQELGLSDVVIHLLDKMTNENAEKFLIIASSASSNRKTVMYSKNDTIVALRKLARIGGIDWIALVTNRDDEYADDDGVELETLEQIYEKERIRNPRIDLTKKWPESDVAISTKNSHGKLVYSRKEILAPLSSYLRKLLFDEDSNAPKKYDLANPVVLDVEYVVMLKILEIIHDCDTTPVGQRRDPSSIFLYEMHLAASNEKLDIPMIRSHCLNYLFDGINAGALERLSRFHVASRLNLSGIKYAMLNGNLMFSWVLINYKDLVYIRDGKTVTLNYDKSEAALSINELFLTINSICSMFPVDPLTIIELNEDLFPQLKEFFYPNSDDDGVDSEAVRLLKALNLPLPAFD